MIQQPDRRSAVRERCSMPVLYVVDNRTHLNSSFDISQKGISFYCPFRPPIGESVSVRFTHPQKGNYTVADGNVVHVHEGQAEHGLTRIGVNFFKVTHPNLSPVFPT